MLCQKRTVRKMARSLSPSHQETQSRPTIPITNRDTAGWCAALSRPSMDSPGASWRYDISFGVRRRTDAPAELWSVSVVLHQPCNISWDLGPGLHVHWRSQFRSSLDQCTSCQLVHTEVRHKCSHVLGLDHVFRRLYCCILCYRVLAPCAESGLARWSGDWLRMAASNTSLAAMVQQKQKSGPGYC